MSLETVAETPVGDLLAAVKKVIDIIRPAIQADDGDIQLHGVDEATGANLGRPVSGAARGWGR